MSIAQAIPVAFVTFEEWQQITIYCQKNCVSRGGDYEVMSDGGISVWFQENFRNANEKIRGTYYPKPTKNTHGYINVLWLTDEVWSPITARNYFCYLFKQAVRRDYHTHYMPT